MSNRSRGSIRPKLNLNNWNSMSHVLIYHVIIIKCRAPTWWNRSSGPSITIRRIRIENCRTIYSKLEIARSVCPWINKHYFNLNSSVPVRCEISPSFRRGIAFGQNTKRVWFKTCGVIVEGTTISRSRSPSSHNSSPASRIKCWPNISILVCRICNN